MKKRYLVRYLKPAEEIVEAHSVHSAVEIVNKYKGASLISVELVDGGEDTRLGPINWCYFCSRPLLCGADAVPIQTWHQVPEHLQDVLPGLDFACPHCAMAKGIIAEGPVSLPTS